MKKIIFSLLLSICSLNGFSQEAPKNVGQLNNQNIGIVNKSNVKIDSNTINSSIRSLKDEANVEMAVLVVDSVKPYAIEDYAIKLAESWKVGTKGLDNGIIMVVAVNDRKARIEVGYGLEGQIPDLVANQILQESAVPLFKEGKYQEGIVKVVGKIKSVAKDPNAYKQSLENKEKKTKVFDVIKFVFWLVLLCLFFGLFAHPLNKYIKVVVLGGVTYIITYYLMKKGIELSSFYSIVAGSVGLLNFTKFIEFVAKNTVQVESPNSSFPEYNQNQDHRQSGSRQSNDRSEPKSGGEGRFGGGGSSADW